MMCVFVCSLFLATVFLVPVCPDPYVIAVFANCSTTIGGSTSLHVVTDVPAEVTVRCLQNYSQVFTSTDTMNFYSQAKYNGDPTTECLFTRKARGHVYWLSLVVAWGGPYGHLVSNHNKYTVTCSFDDTKNTHTAVQNITRGIIALNELQHHLGLQSNSTFTLEVTDISDVPLPDSTIAIGKKIKLISTISGNSNEVSFRVASCCAVDGPTTYPIIMGGCGDGVIIPHNMGFVTTGNRSTSPIFEAFKLTSGYNIQYACNFTVCFKNCDGDNCAALRSKRSTRRKDVDTHLIEVRSVRLTMGGPELPDADYYPVNPGDKPVPRYTTTSKPSSTTTTSAFDRMYRLSTTIITVVVVVITVCIFISASCLVCTMFTVASSYKAGQKIRDIVRSRRDHTYTHKPTIGIQI